MVKRLCYLSQNMHERKQEKHNLIPEEWIANERARQAAVDKLPFSMCADLKSFSNMGQKTLSRAYIGLSAAESVGEGTVRWLNTVPILEIN